METPNIYIERETLVVFFPATASSRSQPMTACMAHMQRMAFTSLNGWKNVKGRTVFCDT